MIDHSRSTTYSFLSLLLQVLNSTSKPSIKIPLQTIDHALSHLANFLTITKILKLLPYYLHRNQLNIIPIDLLDCSDEDLFRFFSPSSSQTSHHQSTRQPSRSSDELTRSRNQNVRDTLCNMIFLAWYELIATREVISLDPQQHHHHDLKKVKRTLIEDQISGQNELERVTIDRSIMPVFLCATPTRIQLGRIERILSDPRQPFNLDRFNSIVQRSDWKLPFKLWFDYRFNRL